MTVREIVEALNLKVLSGEKGLDKEITGAYCSDLLSDVMGNTEEQQVWITLQGHKNAIAVASLKELRAMKKIYRYSVLICRHLSFAVNFTNF